MSTAPETWRPTDPGRGPDAEGRDEAVLEPDDVTAAGILAAAKDHGYTLDRRPYWLHGGLKCGCAAGVEALRRDPGRMDRIGVASQSDLRAAGLSGPLIAGLADGYDGRPERGRAADYRRGFAVGREVARRLREAEPC